MLFIFQKQNEPQNLFFFFFGLIFETQNESHLKDIIKLIEEEGLPVSIEGVI